MWKETEKWRLSIMPQKIIHQFLSCQKTRAKQLKAPKSRIMHSMKRIFNIFIHNEFPAVYFMQKIFKRKPSEHKI